MIVSRRIGLGASPVGRVTWRGRGKSSRRTGAILHRSGNIGFERTAPGTVARSSTTARASRRPASGGDERVEIDSGADFLGSIPIDPLEPCRRGRWPGRSEGAGVACGALQCLLVPALCLYPAAGLFERAGPGPDARFLCADS